MTQEATHDPMHSFAELGRMDLASMELEAVLGRVAELAKDTLAGAAQVSVTLIAAGQASTAASTGPLAIHLDEKQYELGHGPCVDAAQAGETLQITDMETEDRWPDFTPRAVEQGAYSSVSVGLPIQQTVTGALNIYGDKPLAFDDEAVTLAETFASYAAVALSNAHLYRSTAEQAAQVQRAMTNRAVIEQAKGVMAAQQKCTPEDAFSVMTKESQRSNRKLRDIAADIVASASQQA